MISFSHTNGLVNCDCSLQWLLEWSQDSRHEIIGDCRLSGGSVRLSQLRIEDLDCQGAQYITQLVICQIIYSTVVVKSEFNIHAPAGVALQCSVSSLTSSQITEYWWKKVLHNLFLV